MEEKSQSPVPKEVKVQVNFSFPDAVKAIADGKKVTRVEWDNDKIFGFLNGEFISLQKEDGINYQWIIAKGDLEASDWIIIE